LTDGEKKKVKEEGEKNGANTENEHVVKKQTNKQTKTRKKTWFL